MKIFTFLLFSFLFTLSSHSFAEESSPCSSKSTIDQRILCNYKKVLKSYDDEVLLLMNQGFKGINDFEEADKKATELRKQKKALQTIIKRVIPKISFKKK